MYVCVCIIFIFIGQLKIQRKFCRSSRPKNTAQILLCVINYLPLTVKGMGAIFLGCIIYTAQNLYFKKLRINEINNNN